MALSLAFSSHVYSQSRFVDVETGEDKSSSVRSADRVLFSHPEETSNVPQFKGKVSQIADSGRFFCALDEENIKCWNEKGVFLPTKLKSPSYLNAVDRTACAIDTEGVKCWDENNNNLDIPLDFKNPKIVSQQLNAVCVLDDEGVKCWTLDKRMPIEVPSNLKNPKSLVSGDYHSCVLDDEGVKCWGKMKDQPLLKNPTAIFASGSYSCVFDDEGIKCWEDNFYKDNTGIYRLIPWSQIGENKSNIKTLSVIPAINPYNNPPFCLWPKDTHKDIGPYSCIETGAFETINTVSNGYRRNCVVDEVGVNCWNPRLESNYKKGMITFIPHNLKNIEYIKSGGNGQGTICAKLKTGIRCWKDSNYFGKARIQEIDTFKTASANAKISYVSYTSICIIDNNTYKCSAEVYEGKYTTQKLITIQMQNPQYANYYCVRADEGYACWNQFIYERDIRIVKFSLDHSKFFYSEKSQPLNFANQILLNIEDSNENIGSLYLLREKIVELFLTGFQSETSSAILNNALYMKKYYIESKLVNPDYLSLRKSVQLRFILDVMANSLNSSKYLLSDSSKIVADKLKVEFANLLSEDDISIEAAGNLVTMTLNESGLMKEMAASHRLVGIKSFYEWAYTYIATGKID